VCTCTVDYVMIWIEKITS